MQLDIPAFDENETLTDRVDVGRRVQAAPSTHPVHVLPQEILDYIVSLVEDPETLLACSLSSRTLLRMATNMTLRHLYVQRDTFEDILRELSSSPLKAYAVRRITLYNPKANPAHTVVPLNEAAALLPYLTNVNHFSVLSQFFDNSASPTVPLQGCAVSRIVTRLTLTFTLFQSPFSGETLLYGASWTPWIHRSTSQATVGSAWA
ncbi:hypothetical protein BC835DRAFT_1326057 [Cytidiella melzeri]|nr:hypothetical protein BC835DRAFT_1326057 [Cytidiella melzeri]